ncbi:hypothetical protein BC938DRAFT_479886 [Jimgerdemannia flammicorona]|uniref:Uncharacterized protein n=1 Tax=Jimgerdemannia flammicorona TaxID=994334 RepID=A0A433QJW5_9FUNG|nr:hypothetical protein BC938DRAFT_479886 [Jimgerdemannia flammicorona]
MLSFVLLLVASLITRARIAPVKISSDGKNKRGSSIDWILFKSVKFWALFLHGTIVAYGWLIFEVTITHSSPLIQYPSTIPYRMQYLSD